MRKALLVVSLTLACSIAAAAPPLFPRTIHLTRVVSDPVSGTTATIDEYLTGDRVVSVRGTRTAIADYSAGRLVVIDRQAGTYSITTFHELAATVPASRALSRAELGRRWNIAPAATSAGQSGDWQEARAVDGSATIRVRRDSAVPLSRAALEVLLGVAYPGAAAEHDQVTIAMAAANEVAASAATSTYALPAEVRIIHAVGNDQLETRNEVIRVGNEEPSPELLAIPAGATRVELPRAALARELREADHLPPSNP